MNYPGYTLVRREDCPEQHGVLTVLNHDVSGATVLLVENEDTNKASILSLSRIISPCPQRAFCAACTFRQCRKQSLSMKS